MCILIIDQDPLAVKHLEKLLNEIAPEKKISGRCRDIRSAEQWLQKNPLPDLIFSVIELPDGLSFDIFNKLEKKPPVIFTCTYEKYAIDAFKANGIYYLLKPVKKEELTEALNRYETFFSSVRPETTNEPSVKMVGFNFNFPYKGLYRKRIL